MSGLHVVQFNMEEVHEKSVDLLEQLEDDRVAVPVAIAALGLSYGRLMSQTILSEEEEVAFMKALMEWGSTYFASGRVN